MRRFAPTAALLSALVLAGSSAAAVTVYSNPFNKRSQVTELKKLGGGKPCGKSWAGEKSLGVTVSEGRTNCSLRSPVRGDGPHPNHFIGAAARVGQRTPKGIRGSIYVGVGLRANREQGYELRVFPNGRRWQLLRNGEVAFGGREGAINPVGKRNQLRLSVEGRAVNARVNGTLVAGFADPGFREVGGRRTVLTFGNIRRGQRTAAGRFDRLRIGLTAVG